MPKPDAFERGVQHILSVLRNARNTGGIDGHGGVPTSRINRDWKSEWPPLESVLEHLLNARSLEVSYLDTLGALSLNRGLYRGLDQFPRARIAALDGIEQMFVRIDTDAPTGEAHWWRLSSKALDEDLKERRLDLENQRSEKEARGVALKDVAEYVCDDDPDEAKELKKQWQHLTGARRLPLPIGKSVRHSQEDLYKPSDILDFLDKNQRIPSNDKPSCLKQLRELQIPMRPGRHST